MSIMASADFDDLGLTGTEGAFNSTGFLGDSRDSDMEAVTLAAKIVPVFFFLVGVTGNVVTIVALYRSKTVDGGSRVYHSGLCLLDLGVLLLSTLRFWLLAVARLDLARLHPALCKLLPCLELSTLMAPPWLLLALLMQVQEGLRKSHAPGANVTCCKALVYSGTALVVAVVFNLHRLFLYESPEEEEEADRSEDGRSVRSASPPTNISGLTKTVRWNDSHVDSRSGDSVCVPTSEAYATFAHDVWPWLSVSASLVIPLVTLTVGVVLVFRLVCLRSRRSDHVSSPASFASLTLSALLTGVFCLITSYPLCVLCLTQARAFWTDYGAMFGGRGVEVEGYSASCVLRLLFYGQFAFRWTLTCWCYGLWNIVSRMCRCTQSSGRS